MKDKTPTKRTGKLLVVVVISLVALIIIALALYFFIFKTSPNKPETVTQNKENAAILKTEKEQAPIVIDDKASTDSQNKSQGSSEDTADTDPTADLSGLSTNLDRADVHPAVEAVLAVYRDFLAKLQAVPTDQRQAVADQYIADNSTMFSSTYNYLNSGNLHLFPQVASVALPESVIANSAIVDPEDPTQIIVQIFMPPDTSWSLLLYVKMNQDGTLGTFETLVIRNNQTPL